MTGVSHVGPMAIFRRCLFFALTGVLAAGGSGCATPRAAEIQPLRPRQVRAFTRKGRDPRAFFFSIRMDSEGHLTFVDAHRQATDHTAILPFTALRSAPIPLLDVRAGPGGRVYQALVDSTAAENWTSIDRARLLNLTPIYIEGTTIGTEPGHVEEDLSGLLSVSPAVMLGSVRLDVILFFARTTAGPLWPLTRSPVAAHADAVFGIPFLRSFAYVQWDYPGREMVFSAVQSYEPDPDALLATLPVVSYDAGLEIIAFLDGRETQVLLDTAGDFAIAMDKPAGPLLPQLRLDDLVARQVRTVSSRTLSTGRLEVPRIGVQWLASYRVTLDNHKGVVYIESP